MFDDADSSPKRRPSGVGPVDAREHQKAQLAQLDGLLAQAQQATAKAVLLAGALAGSGAAEAVAGLPLELHLGLSARMTGADRAVFISAGETLVDMPVTAQLFADGALSWGQVRGIVRAVKRLHATLRALVDRQVRQTVTDRDGVDGFDPDDLIWAVEQAVTQLRERRSVERSEQRRAAGDYLALQPDFDGGIRGWFAFSDPVAAATVVNGLDARAGTPAAAPERADRTVRTDRTGRAAATDAAGAGASAATSRAKQYGQALVGLCRDALAGSTPAGGAARPAKPLLLVHVDLSQVHVNSAGQIELNVRGPIPTVCARTVEALTRDADVRAVLFDGARPLAVSRKVAANTIPTSTRTAVRARDKACRFPGSRDPAGHSDVHHATSRADGGDHHPDNLLLLSRRHHTIVHDHGWKLAVDRDDGAVTATRNNTTYRSLRPGTQLSQVQPGAPEPPPPRRPRLRANSQPPAPPPTAPPDLPF